MIGRRAFVAVLVASMLAPLSAGTAQEKDDQLHAGLSAYEARPGAEVDILGAGFPGRSTVWFQICGNDALNGSADCDLPRAKNVTANENGRFYGTIRVGLPPKPCPCVVRISSANSTQTLKIPLTVIGASTAEPRRTAPEVGVLTVERASLEGSGPWTTIFGGAPQRTVSFTVANTGTQPVRDAVVVLSWTERSGPPISIPTPSLGTIDAGGRRTYRVPITFGSLGIGGHTVHGEIRTIGLPAQFETSFRTFPWGLLVIALALLVALAAYVVWGFSRRSAGEEPSFTGDVTALWAAFEQRRPQGRGRVTDASNDPVVVTQQPRVAIPVLRYAREAGFEVETAERSPAPKPGRSRPAAPGPSGRVPTPRHRR